MLVSNKVCCPNCKYYIWNSYCAVIDKTKQFLKSKITGEEKYEYPHKEEVEKIIRPCELKEFSKIFNVGKKKIKGNYPPFYCKMVSEGCGDSYNYPVKTSYLNSKGDCKFYKRKWWKFWI